MIKINRTFGGTLTAVAAASLLTGAAGAKPLVAITPGITQPPAAATATSSDSIAPYYRNIDPFYRNIGAFWGSVNPFYRNIGAFWGDIDPFYRNIGAFWGDINPLYRNIGAFNGVIFPDYRNIGAFWDGTGTQFNAIDSAWGALGSYSSNPAGYASLRDQLLQLSSSSESVWGAAVRSQTGKSFTEAFATPLFAKFGINLNDPASLANLPASERGHLFIDWYDGLMNFAGTDHVDWWMKVANWTPKVTQNQGSGKDTTIGLVDFFVAGDADIKSKTVFYDGVSNYSNGHGAAVGSLMVSAHDGKGVMGIAPNARIAAYNPFDASGSADWPDVKTGIVKVTGAGASVVNLSLGVPGWTLHPDWRTVFADSAVSAVKNKTVYVIAAGNDGITQTQDIAWAAAPKAVATVTGTVAGALAPAAPLVGNPVAGDASGTTFIVVGSVDPNGTISDFSNRPGEVCLLKADNKGCDVKLKDRFIVAPGELILVSDDAGGVVRRSGTSFAAPLVSGAIALLHDRWPWLKNLPDVTAAIILGSAKDLGAKGNDPVYGVGLLDVTASQSPLSFDKLSYYQVTGNQVQEVKAPEIRKDGVQSAWETKGIFFSAFEKFGANQRDFQIPLSSRLVGTTAYNGEQFQDYIYSRLVDWITASKTGKFSDLNRQTATVPNGLGLSLTMTAGTVNPTALRYSRSGRMLQSSLRLDAPSGRFGFTVGQGDGAIALGGHDGFAMFSDYEAATGGVNPILGFASGGGYAAANVAITPRLGLTIGTSEQRRARRLDLIGVETAQDYGAFAGLEAYRANATHVSIDYRLSPSLKLQASLTSLRENGLLGIRSVAPGDLAGGSKSDAVTLGADLAIGHGLSISASATSANTQTRGNRAALSTDGLTSSAYEMALTKQHVFSASDSLRLSVAQPLTVEDGTFEFRGVEVIDRQTGEIGIVTHQIDAAASRRFVAEGIYGLALGSGAELSAFGRGEAGNLQSGEARYTMGARLKVQF